MIALSEQLAGYLSAFSDFEKSATSRQLPWLCDLRQSAFARFCEVGFPSTHEEDWRFTNVSALAETNFQLLRGREKLSSARLVPYRMAASVAQLVFVDGAFAPELSEVRNVPKGVIATGLAAQLAANPDSLKAHLGSYLNIQRDAFCALNTAFAEDGAYIHISAGLAVDEPFHVLYVSTNSTPSVTYPRNLVIAEVGSQATIVEEYVSLAESASFCNSVTELVAGENSTLSHFYIERENKKTFNISTLRTQQSRNSNVHSHSVLLGGGLVRNNVHAVLAGEGGECLINGLFSGNGHQHMDNYMLVEHVSPHCGSRQFYNGVLDDHASGVFHGRIIVHKDAQKTDAKQTNRNLLLSDDAHIDTKPQLEIYADDVKCTHGATIGQIDQEALFYLRSRGFDEAAARKLLLLAFAGECLDRMNTGSARDHVASLVNAMFDAARAQ